MRVFWVVVVLSLGAGIGTGEEAGDHWSFQAVTRPAPPSFPGAGHPIDAFVRERLSGSGQVASPTAEPALLLRRLHLDLTGLLPEPDETGRFLRAWQSDPERAWTAAVDHLLASPHFGERWGRHWLDLGRYADSDGYLGDTLRPWAWLYRDWVIDAINADLPFDRFSIEQLAGDLIPGADEGQLIATGFHRNVLKNTEAGADRELDRTKRVVDRVAATGTTWLGLTLACAECHDHKHDPVSQREFFELYAFFNNAEDRDLPVTPDPARWQPVSLPAKGDEKAAKPRAQTLVEQSGDARRDTHIHLRGDYASPGDRVTPGTLAVLHPLTSRADTGPDRLDLAHWLFDEANPLTPRVAANRIWQHLFGTGLVSTPDDFGTHGAFPSHPALLDWLASEFVRLGWSRKALIRTIVLSETYRQSSTNHYPEVSNELLWRQNSFRIDAEAVRDVHLCASGLLSREIGGASIHPPLPEFVTAVGRSVKWPESTGADRHRRGLYIFLKRTVLYPMLTAFDAPDTATACARRERTNTPMQALTLLNDPVFFACAEELGRETHRRHGTDSDAAVRDLVRRCLNREPREDEAATLRLAWKDFARAEDQTDPAFPHIATARVVMNLDEFITRD